MSKAAETAGRTKAFEALGLPPDAGSDQVRRAFRRLALDCHPDLYGGSPEKARAFQNLVEAHRIAMDFLGRPDSAESIDIAPPPGYLGASPPQPGPIRPLEYRLRLDFTQAALGGEVSLRYPRRIPCPCCRGENGASCGQCAGSGLVRETAIIAIRIPPGVAEGESLRIRGAGNFGRNGSPAGDLHILISTLGHPAFRRSGLDIHSEVRVPAWRLEDGGPVRVPTIHGAQRIAIPSGTASGALFRLREMGVRRGDRNIGDHIVRVGEIRPEDYEPPPPPGHASLKRGATMVR